MRKRDKCHISMRMLESRNTVPTILCAGQQRRHRQKEQNFELNVWGEGGKI